MASTPSEEETSADSSVTETGNVLRDQTCELGKEPVEPPREEDRADDGDQGAPPANNPTRDALAEGLVGLLRPSLETLDSSVLSARQAQLELKERIEGLERLLNRLEAKEQRCPVDLEGYIVKLQSTKQRINVINNILQAAQDRLNAVHQNSVRETSKRRLRLLEASGRSASSPEGETPSASARLRTE